MPAQRNSTASIQRSALLRYKLLDKLFNDFSKEYTLEDLRRIVNDELGKHGFNPISERQLYNDKKYMIEVLRGPIETKTSHHSRRPYFRYSEPTELFSQKISMRDMAVLRTTIDMLSKYRGNGKNVLLEKVIRDLETTFEIPEAESKNVISFEQNDKLKGMDNLSTIIDAVVEHQPLYIEYKPYGGVLKQLFVHPYYVKQYNNRWFLFCLDEATGQLATMALDRIETITPSDMPFRDTTIDFATYFDNVVGVSVPSHAAKIEHVELRFSEKRFPYVTSKPIHPSQQTTGECTVSLDVILTRELEQQILSFGCDVEVLAPKKLRDRVRKNIQRNLKQYEEN